MLTTHSNSDTLIEEQPIKITKHRITRRKTTFMNKMLAYLVIALIAFQSGNFFLEGVQCASSADDFYGLLEIQRSATKSDIKKAYRNLSKKYHPDKNPGDEDAANHYKKINRAYEVLSDDDKRQMFDSGGIDGLERFER